VPHWLNLIPLSALAAILIVTGWKLASPEVFQSVWARGLDQFLPFLATVVAILFTDLLMGIVVGLATSAGVFLYGNSRPPGR
jgi:carbonic anhydrase/SulP family sulfate permease